MNDCLSSVYEPRWPKIGSSKKIVGDCKYFAMLTFSNSASKATFLDKPQRRKARVVFHLAAVKLLSNHQDLEDGDMLVDLI